MKLPSIFSIRKAITVFLLMQFSILFSSAQVVYTAKDDLNLLVSGSSTLHDWDMKSAKGECKATFIWDENGQLSSISELTFITPAEALKSGHDGMDKNAYKCLKTDKHKNITFQYSLGKINSDGTINCIGKLTIGGVTHDAELMANYKINPDKSITISGNKKINMVYYNMEPSTFMGGMFKIGDEINLKFAMTLQK